MTCLESHYSPLRDVKEKELKKISLIKKFFLGICSPLPFQNLQYCIMFQFIFVVFYSWRMAL